MPALFIRRAIGLIVGIEADPDRDDWHDWYSRRLQFCQWTLVSKPGHPILREDIEVCRVVEVAEDRICPGPRPRELHNSLIHLANLV
jgi:mannosyltransferase OCH1-like enzyme